MEKLYSFAKLSISPMMPCSHILFKFSSDLLSATAPFHLQHVLRLDLVRAVQEAVAPGVFHHQSRMAWRTWLTFGATLNLDPSFQTFPIIFPSYKFLPSDIVMASFAPSR